MYTISEIVEYDSDQFGNLHCVFKVEGDDKNNVRVISTESYYDWVSQQDEYKEYYINLNEEDEYNFNTDFNFEEWKENNEDEEIVKEFIYSNYNYNDLPDAEEYPF